MNTKKENKKVLFTQENIEVVCPEKMVWDEMKIVGEGKRLCEGCDKVLVDVSGYSQEEVNELQRKDPSICVAVTNVLLVSSLSFSLLSAEGSLVENNKSIATEINNTFLGKVKAPVLVDILPPVTLGVPARPICSAGIANLNTIKRFFGFKEDRSCVEE